MSFALVTDGLFVKFESDTNSFSLTNDINQAALFEKYTDPSIFGFSNGAVGLIYKGNGLFVVQYGFIIYTASLSAQDETFSWYFNSDGSIRNGTGLYLYINLEIENKLSASFAPITKWSQYFPSSQPEISDTSTITITSNSYVFNGEMTFYGQNYLELPKINYNTLYTKFKVSNVLTGCIVDNILISNSNIIVSNVQLPISSIENEIYLHQNTLVYNKTFYSINPISFSKFVLGSNSSYQNFFIGQITDFRIYDYYIDYYQIINLFEDAIWGPFDANNFTYYTIKSNEYITTTFTPPLDVINSNTIKFSNGFTLFSQNPVGEILDITSNNFIPFDTGHRIHVYTDNVLINCDIYQTGELINKTSIPYKQNFWFYIQPDMITISGDISIKLNEQFIQPVGTIKNFPHKPINSDIIELYNDISVGGDEYHEKPRVILSSYDDLYGNVIITAKIPERIILNNISNITSLNYDYVIGDFDFNPFDIEKYYYSQIFDLYYYFRQYYTINYKSNNSIQSIYGPHYIYTFDSPVKFSGVKLFLNGYPYNDNDRTPYEVWFFGKNDKSIQIWEQVTPAQIYQYNYPASGKTDHSYIFEQTDYYTEYIVLIKNTSTPFNGGNPITTPLVYYLTSIQWISSEKDYNFTNNYKINVSSNVYLYNQIVPKFDFFNYELNYNGKLYTYTNNSEIIKSNFLELYVDRRMALYSIDTIYQNSTGTLAVDSYITTTSGTFRDNYLIDQFPKYSISTKLYGSLDGVFYEKINILYDKKIDSSNLYLYYRLLFDIKPNLAYGYYISFISDDGIILNTKKQFLSSTIQLFAGIKQIIYGYYDTTNLNDNDIKIIPAENSNVNTEYSFKNGKFKIYFDLTHYNQNISGPDILYGFYTYNLPKFLIDVNDIDQLSDINLIKLTYTPKQLNNQVPTYTINTETYTSGFNYDASDNRNVVLSEAFKTTYGDGIGLSTIYNSYNQNVFLRTFGAFMKGPRTLNLISNDDAQVYINGGIVLTTTNGIILFSNVKEITSDGNSLYVTESGGSRRKILSDGQTISTISINQPYLSDEIIGGITYYDNSLYMTDLDYYIIYKLTTSGFVEKFSGKFDGIGEPIRGLVDGNRYEALYDYPETIISDGRGIFYVAESNLCVIRKLFSNGSVVTVAGSTRGYNDGIGSLAQFDTPKGMCVVENDLYIADYGNSCIRKMNLSTYNVTTFAGVAGQSFPYDGSIEIARLQQPHGIIYKSNAFYITDSVGTIRKISNGYVETIAGAAGQYDALDGNGTDARFNKPLGLVEMNGDIYICDSQNFAIRKLDSNNVVTTFAGELKTRGYSDRNLNIDINSDDYYSFELRWRSLEPIPEKSVFSLSNLGPFYSFDITDPNPYKSFKIDGVTYPMNREFETKQDYGLSKIVKFSNLKLEGTKIDNEYIHLINTNYSNVNILQNSNEYVILVEDYTQYNWRDKFINIANISEFIYTSQYILPTSQAVVSNILTPVNLPGDFLTNLIVTNDKYANFYFTNINVSVNSTVSNVSDFLLGNSTLISTEPKQFIWTSENEIVYSDYIEYNFDHPINISGVTINNNNSELFIRDETNVDLKTYFKSTVPISYQLPNNDNSIFIHTENFTRIMNSNTQKINLNVKDKIYFNGSYTGENVKMIDENKNTIKTFKPSSEYEYGFISSFHSNGDYINSIILETSNGIISDINENIITGTYKDFGILRDDYDNIIKNFPSSLDYNTSFFGNVYSNNYLFISNLFSTIIKTELSGNIYIGGITSDKNIVIKDDESNNKNIIQNSNINAIIMKFNSEQVYEKSIRLSNGYCYSMVKDYSDNIYFGGVYGSKSALMNDTSILRFMNNVTSNVGFICKLDNDFNYIYSRTLKGNSKVLSITVDHENNLYISGIYRGYTNIVDEYDNILISLPETIQNAAFLSKFDSSGNYIFTRIIDSVNNDSSTSITCDMKYIYFCGTYYGYPLLKNENESIITNLPGNDGGYLIQIDHDGYFINSEIIKNGTFSSIDMGKNVAGYYNNSTRITNDNDDINIYLTNTYVISTDFDSNNNFYVLCNKNSNTIYINDGTSINSSNTQSLLVKFNSSNKLIWKLQSNVIPLGMKIMDDNIYVSVKYGEVLKTTIYTTECIEIGNRTSPLFMFTPPSVEFTFNGPRKLQTMYESSIYSELNVSIYKYGFDIPGAYYNDNYISLKNSIVSSIEFSSSNIIYATGYNVNKNSYLTAYTSNEIVGYINPGIATDILGLTNSRSSYVIRFKPDYATPEDNYAYWYYGVPHGKITWYIITDGISDNFINNIKTDSYENIYICGTKEFGDSYMIHKSNLVLNYRDEINVYYVANTSNIIYTFPNEECGYVANFEPDGTIKWVSIISNCTISKIQINSSDEVYVSGNTNGISNIYNADSIYCGYVKGSFIIKYSPTGNVVEHRYCSSGSINYISLATDDILQFTFNSYGKSYEDITIDDIYGIVSFKNYNTQFIPNTPKIKNRYDFIYGNFKNPYKIFKTKSININENFLTKLDEIGNPLWTVSYGTTNDKDSINDITLDDNLNIFIIGNRSNTTLNFTNSDGSIYTTSSPLRETSPIIIKYSNSGIIQNMFTDFNIYNFNSVGVKYLNNYFYALFTSYESGLGITPQLLIVKLSPNFVFTNFKIKYSQIAEKIEVDNSNIFTTSNLYMCIKFNQNLNELWNISIPNNYTTSIYPDYKGGVYTSTINSNGSSIYHINDSGIINWISNIQGNISYINITSNLLVSGNGNGKILYSNNDLAYTFDGSFILKYNLTGEPILFKNIISLSNFISISDNTVLTHDYVAKYDDNLNVLTLDTWKRKESGYVDTCRILLPEYTTSIQFTTNTLISQVSYKNYTTLIAEGSNNFPKYVEYILDGPPPMYITDEYVPRQVDEIRTSENIGNVLIFNDGILSTDVSIKTISNVTFIKDNMSSQVLRKKIVGIKSIDSAAINNQTGTTNTFTYTGNVNMFYDGPYNYFYDEQLPQSLTLTGIHWQGDEELVSMTCYGGFAQFSPYQSAYNSKVFISPFIYPIKYNLYIESFNSDWANTVFEFSQTFRDDSRTELTETEQIPLVKYSTGVISSYTYVPAETENIQFSTNGFVVTTNSPLSPDLIYGKFYDGSNILPYDTLQGPIPISNLDNFRGFVSITQSANVNVVGKISEAQIDPLTKTTITGYFSLPETGTYTANLIYNPVTTGGNTVVDTNNLQFFTDTLNITGEIAYPFRLVYYNNLNLDTKFDVKLINNQTSNEYSLSDYTFTEEYLTKIPNLYRTTTAVANYKTVSG